MKWLFPVAALLFIALIVLPDFLQKWLWMRQLDYAAIFWTLFSGQSQGLTGMGFAFAFLFLWLNVRQASKSGLGGADSRTAAARIRRHLPRTYRRTRRIALRSD